MQRLLGKRLQTQLLVWTALILVISVTGLFEIRMYLNLSNLEQNLRDRSETTAKAVEKALSIGVPGVDLTTLGGRLLEFAEADRTLDRLDIVERTPSGVRILASSDPTPEPLIQTVPLVETTNKRESNGRRDMITIHPVANTDLAIVALMSFEFVDRYEALNRVRDPVFEVVLITLVIALLNLMYKRAVSSRFDELLSGIRRAQQGDLAMIPDTREDEIGVIARTLNNLLAQVRSFNDELKREVANATESLNQRNAELEEITRQVVAMQRQLLQAERLATVGQMAATFAHEIGSPMSSLSVHVQLLLEDPALTQEQRETLEVVREQIKAMIQIVNDLLRTARRGPSDFVPTDVNEALRTVIRLVQPKLKSQRVGVNARYETVPSVRAYPLYLQEAFLNLVNNASDAMPDGGTLSIRTTFDESSERVQVVISDTGRGIEPSVVENIFERFVTTKAMGEGTGLGLGIVKEILTGHRGTIQISPAKSGGTEVHITLPADTGVGVLRDRAVMEAERRV
jgi:signal transduction histidine kinase